MRRVLIVGRSAAVLVDAVGLLRARGYSANASNQFGRLLDDYDLREVDLVILGGMVPPGTKEQLRADVSKLNSQVSFMQGLGGIAPLLVAQVEQFFEGAVPDLEFDAATRVLRVTLADDAHVVVEGLWATFAPPDPIPHSAVVFDGELSPGVHEIAVPDGVPSYGSFASVRVGGRVSALQIGETPQSLNRTVATQPLPAPEPVVTRFPWG